MVKYLRINNQASLQNIIYKMKPTHSSIEVKDLQDWMVTAVNNYEMDSNEFKKTTFKEKLCFKGLVNHGEYFTTGNGILIDPENKKYISFSNEFLRTNNNFTVEVFEIIPELKKLEKLADFELDVLYDYYFIDKNKKFPDFTEEEWEKFLDKSINKKALKWTEDI